MEVRTLSRKAIVSSLVAFLILMAVAAAVQAGNGRRADWFRDRTEVLLGSHHCGAGADGGFRWVTLSATGDIFAEQALLQYPVSPGGSPAEICDASTDLVSEFLTRAGCSVGPVRATSDETGESRDVSFTCHARRSTLISVIADLSRLMLSS
jgi:hypothetical protein